MIIKKIIDARAFRYDPRSTNKYGKYALFNHIKILVQDTLHQ